MKGIQILLSGLFLACLLAGAVRGLQEKNEKPRSPIPPPKKSQAGEKKAKKDEKVGIHKEIVAVVNGKEVHRKEFVEALINQFGVRFLNQYIEDVLVQEEASRLNITVDEKVLDEEVEQDIKKMLDGRYRGDEKAMKEQLERSGFTVEGWRRNTRHYKLMNLLSKEIIKRTRKITDSGILKIFEQRYGEDGIQYEVRHILASTNISVSSRYTIEEYKANLPEIEKDAEEKAKGLLARIQKGEDFAELAAQESDDYTKRNGGLLDDFWRGRYKEDFQKSVDELQVGEIGGPFKSSYGYHMVKIEPSEEEESIQVRQIFILAEPEPGADVDARREADQKAREKAERILKSLKEGADFAQVAAKESDDPASREKGGDLGYIQRGDRVPEFERAAFVLKVGEISGPVRSQYGYHIIQVLDKKVKASGEGKKVRHILISTQYNKVKERLLKPTIEESARKKMEEILEKLRGGADFAELAKSESDDAITRKDGGFVRNYNKNRYGPEFDAAVKKLNEKEISGIVETQQGFHIIKLERMIKTDYDSVKGKILEEEENREPTTIEIGQLRERLRNSAEIIR